MLKKKYYIIFILAILSMPIVLNFSLQLPSIVKVIGDAQTWLSFWASFIGAIASFAMIAITYHTLQQNQSQLDEIKRQWEEEHRPFLSCRVIVYKQAFFLQIYNPSKFDAHNVSIVFGDDLLNNINPKYKDLYNNTSSTPVFIASGKAWNSLIGWCEEVNKSWKDLNFEIRVDVAYNEKYTLHTTIPISSFINRKNMVVQSNIEDYLEDLALGLVKPHSTANHKTVQVSLEEIAKTLNRINSQISNLRKPDNMES